MAPADELGIQRTLLYKWRKKFEADEAIGDPVPVNAREGRLRNELDYVKRLLAEKALEARPSPRQESGGSDAAFGAGD